MGREDSGRERVQRRQAGKQEVGPHAVPPGDRRDGQSLGDEAAHRRIAGQA